MFEFIAAVPKSMLVYTLVWSSLAEKLWGGGGAQGQLEGEPAAEGSVSPQSLRHLEQHSAEPLRLVTLCMSVITNTRRSEVALCCHLCGSPPCVSRLVAYAASFLGHISLLKCRVCCIRALQGKVWLMGNHFLPRLERDA